jgi:hypothetical protein
MQGISFGKRHLPLAGGSCSFSDTCTHPLSTASSRRDEEIVSVFYGPTFYLHTSLRCRTICITLV